MFTGIVEDVGKIKNIAPRDKEVVFTVGTENIDPQELKIGESVSVDGTCLTVVWVKSDDFAVEASHETLRKTNLAELKQSSKVNLERALRAGDRMGGHFVTGHVDGVGKVESKERVGESVEFWFSLPVDLSRFMVEKGSVAISGVSLTVNEVEGNKFSVNIIPHTLKVTTFGELQVGASVNIECDIVGKYVERFVNLKQSD